MPGKKESTVRLKLCRVPLLIGVLSFVFVAFLNSATAQVETGEPIVRIADLQPGTGDAYINGYRSIGSKAFFASSSTTTAWWFTDGTSEGTLPLSHVSFENCRTTNNFLNNNAGVLYPPKIGNFFYFCATNSTTGSELWRSDGTVAGTSLALDLVPGGGSSLPYGLIAVDSTLYFFAGDNNEHHLWRYDPPAAPIDLGRVGSSSPVVAMGGAIYFIGSFEEQTYLWRSDGTVVGTGPLAPIGRVFEPDLLVVGDKLFLTSYDRTVNCPQGRSDCQLWVSDGTAAGTRSLLNLPSVEVIPSRFFPTPAIKHITVFGNKVLFYREDGSTPSVWVSDGTPAGTQQLFAGQAFLPTSARSSDSAVIYIPGTSGLWRSDGTVAGTTRLIDESTASVVLLQNQLLFTSRVNNAFVLKRSELDGSQPIKLADMSTSSFIRLFDDEVFFGGKDIQHGVEPWLSDGTIAGTRLLTDLNPGAGSSLSEGSFSTAPDVKLIAGDKLVFVASDGRHGNEPFVTDGTATGTRLLADTVSIPDGSDPEALASLGNKLLFVARPDLRSPYTLYSSQGTTATTLPITALVGGERPAISGYEDTHAPGGVVNGRYIVLLPAGPLHPSQLWVSDGTAAGTILLAEASSISWLSHTNNRLVFSVDVYETSLVRRQLYYTDGTTAGTRQVGTFASINEVINFNGADYFFATRDDIASLWRSDGTAAGTVPVLPGYMGRRLVIANSLFFFTSLESDQLWRSDGTVEGTYTLPVNLVYNSKIVAGIDRVYMHAADAQNYGLFTSDGTIEGTRSLDNFAGAYDFELQVSGNRAFYSIASYGLEGQFKTSEGTPESTRLLATIFDSNGDYDLISLLGVIDGVMLFQLTPDNLSDESVLWRSDGTPQGTYRVQDLNVRDIEVVGNQLFFSASTDLVDYELWATSGTTSVQAPASVGIAPGSSTFLGMSLLSGGNTPQLTATALITVSFTLAPGLTYQGNDVGVEPVITGNTYTFSLEPAEGILARRNFGIRLALASDTALGTRLPVMIRTASNSTSVEILSAQQVYAPMIWR
jgi:ELWxxDGT repeat protein